MDRESTHKYLDPLGGDCNFFKPKSNIWKIINLIHFYYLQIGSEIWLILLYWLYKSRYNESNIIKNIRTKSQQLKHHIYSENISDQSSEL